MKISHTAVNHPVYIAMILIALIFFGVFSVIGMNVAFISSFDVPMVYVLAIYPGADPETIENDIIRIFEDDFVTLQDFSSMSSTAMDSLAITTITFNDGVDVYDMLPEVRNRISQFEDQLPDGLSGTPQALVGGIQMVPIMTFSFETGNDTVRTTEYFNDEILPQITRIPGVSTVELSGSKELEVEIKLDIDRMTALHISPAVVYQILNYNNTSLPLGSSTYRDKNASVKFDGSYESLEDIRNLTIGATEDGTLIHLSDVATVSLTAPDSDVIVTENGEDLIVVSVCKRSDGNTVTITNEIKEILAKAAEDTHGAFRYNVVSDDSRIVDASIASVINSGVMGVVVAVIIIFLILGDVKATFTIALSLPISILFTFIGMRIMGISINLLSLSGIVIALGSVVDGSIVLLTQVYGYYQQKKEGRYLYTVSESIYRGSDDVGASIAGSVVTTVIVFIPIALLDGIVGQILHDISITYMLALSASFVAAVVLIPFFLKLFLREDNRGEKDNIITRTVTKVQQQYARSVGWALDKRKFIIFISIIILIVTVWCVMQLGITFIPSTDNSDFYVNIDFPQNYTLDRVEEGMYKAEAILRREVPEVQTVVNVAGDSNSMVTASGGNSGYLHVVLVPVAERSRNIHDIIRLMQTRITEEIPDVTVNVTNGGFDYLLGYISDGGGYGITLTGTDINDLYSEAKRLEDHLKSDPEVMTTSINTSFETYTGVIAASYDYLSAYGLTSTEAALTTAILFNGMDVGSYKDGNEYYDIRLTSDITDEPITENTLNNLNVISSTGLEIGYSGITDFETKLALSTIHHTDRSTTITISASTVGESTSGISSRMDEYLAENPLMNGISTQDGGINKLVADAISPVMSAMAIAFFLVYMVMVFQFENFQQPLLIFFSIPFCIIGVAIALLIANSTLSLVSILGIISLGGTAVNNGIILIDYFNNSVKKQRSDLFTVKGIILREEDSMTGKLSYEEDYAILKESIVSSCYSRLKSILMTSLTTMFGVVPMAMDKGEGSEIYAPLGQAIAGGLIVSTLISLYLVPAMYYIMENRKLKKTYGLTTKEAGRVLRKEIQEA